MFLIAEADFGLYPLRDTSLNQTAVLATISLGWALSAIHLGTSGNIHEQIRHTICGDSDPAHYTCTRHYSSFRLSLAQKDHPYLKNWKYCSKPGNISCLPENKRKLLKPEEVPAEYPLQDTDVLFNSGFSVFVSNDVKVKHDYASRLATLLNSSSQQIDICSAEKAANAVNTYVEMETAGRIQNLVEKETFETGQQARLINTDFFHGNWAIPFAGSKFGKFYKKERDFKGTYYMKHERQSLPLFITNDFMALGLPYKDQKYRLTIALPRKRFQLAKSLKNLTGKTLNVIITNNENSTVNVAFPKFKLEAEIEIDDILQKNENTTRAIDKLGHIVINEIREELGPVAHKVMIDFDEKGTTAAAASTIEMMDDVVEINKDKVIGFEADHPFLFVLSKEGHVLFTGLYYG